MFLWSRHVPVVCVVVVVMELILVLLFLWSRLVSVVCVVVAVLVLVLVYLFLRCELVSVRRMNQYLALN